MRNHSSLALKKNTGLEPGTETAGLDGQSMNMKAFLEAVKTLTDGCMVADARKHFPRVLPYEVSESKWTFAESVADMVQDRMHNQGQSTLGKDRDSKAIQIFKEYKGRLDGKTLGKLPSCAVWVSWGSLESAVI